MTEDDAAVEKARLDELLSRLDAFDDQRLSDELQVSRESTRRAMEDFIAQTEHGREPGALEREEFSSSLDIQGAGGQEGSVHPADLEAQMDDTLGTALTHSAAPTTPHTEDLSGLLRELVSDAESRAMARQGSGSPRRRVPIRVMASAAVVAATFGAGAAANAAGLLPSWGPDVDSARHVQIVASAGNGCQATYTITPVGAPSAETGEVMSVAQSFLARFDTRSIDVAGAMRAYVDGRPSSQAGEGAGPDTTTQTRVLAIGAELYQRLSSELQARKLNPNLITITSFDNCDYGALP